MNSSNSTFISIAVFSILAIIIVALLIAAAIRNKKPERVYIDTVENYIKTIMELPKPEFTYVRSNTPAREGSSRGTVRDVLKTVKQPTDDKYIIEIDRILIGLIVYHVWRLKSSDFLNLKKARERCFNTPEIVDKWNIYTYALQVNQVLDKNYFNVFFSDLLGECFEVTDENKARAEQYTRDYSSYLSGVIDGPDGHGLRVKSKILYDYCEMYTFERELFSRDKNATDYKEVMKDHNTYIREKKEQLKEFIFKYSRGEETIDLYRKSMWKQEDLYIAIMCNKRQLERIALVNNPERAKKIINPPKPPKPRDPRDEYWDWMNGFTGIQSP